MKTNYSKNYRPFEASSYEKSILSPYIFKTILITVEYFNHIISVILKESYEITRKHFQMKNIHD